MDPRAIVELGGQIRQAVATLAAVGVNRQELDGLVRAGLTKALATATNDDAVILGRVLSPTEMKRWAPPRFTWAGPRVLHNQEED